ncbi:MAG: hypothetical protein V5A23_09615 [Halobacteriales archaeon]
MLRDAIRGWLVDHPEVLTGLFLAGLYLQKGVDITQNGPAGGTYKGP